MKTFLVTVILFVSSLTCYAQHPSVCHVQTNNGGGSGCLFARQDEWSLILTAGHVIWDAGKNQPARITFPENGKSTVGVIWTWHRGMDVGFVIVKTSEIGDLQPVEVRSTRAKVGEYMITDGFPAIGGKQQWIQFEGKVIQYTTSDGFPVMHCSNSPSSGHSGGPVFDKNWQLISIMSGYVSKYRNGPPVKSFGVPIDAAIEWMDGLAFKMKNQWYDVQHCPGGT